MSDIAGAIGVAQMGKLENIVAQRRSLAARLTARLATVPGLIAQAEPSGRVHAYQSYVVLLDTDIDRDGVVDGLKTHGVESTIGTYALHMEPVFQRLGYCDDDLPGTRVLAEHSLTLPLFPGMSDAELEQVATAVADVAHRG
jgi:dTDP-4-amino-4,6-dideoxygalactose transaminase